MLTEKDLAEAFKAGWKSREKIISIIQPTNARQEFYGERARKSATVRPAKYHHSRFTTWMKTK